MVAFERGVRQATPHSSPPAPARVKQKDGACARGPRNEHRSVAAPAALHLCGDGNRETVITWASGRDWVLSA